MIDMKCPKCGGMLEADTIIEEYHCKNCERRFKIVPVPNGDQYFSEIKYNNSEYGCLPIIVALAVAFAIFIVYMLISEMPNETEIHDGQKYIVEAEYFDEVFEEQLDTVSKEHFDGAFRVVVSSNTYHIQRDKQPCTTLLYYDASDKTKGFRKSDIKHYVPYGIGIEILSSWSPKRDLVDAGTVLLLTIEQDDSEKKGFDYWHGLLKKMVRHKDGKESRTKVVGPYKIRTTKDSVVVYIRPKK